MSVPTIALNEWQQRLLDETRELARKLNKLNDFMSGDVFPRLDRKAKDLLYEQNIAMTKYLQVLSQRLEYYSIKFTHKY